MLSSNIEDHKFPFEHSNYTEYNPNLFQSKLIEVEYELAENDPNKCKKIGRAHV